VRVGGKRGDMVTLDGIVAWRGNREPQGCTEGHPWGLTSGSGGQDGTGGDHPSSTREGVVSVTAGWGVGCSSEPSAVVGSGMSIAIEGVSFQSESSHLKVVG